MTTILAVDDEPLIAMALQCALEDAGYDVVTAANGKQALEQLAHITRPAVMLLDMMMPVMNGPATLAALAKNPDWHTIPVIILSSLPRDTIQAQAKGVAGFLQKPYTVESVLNEIRRVIGR